MSEICTTARPVSVRSSSYCRPRSIVYDTTRLGVESIRVQSGAHVREGWLNARWNRPVGATYRAPRRTCALAFARRASSSSNAFGFDAFEWKCSIWIVGPAAYAYW